ncbi:polymorphic toxin-type HINT domain-containing protein [Leptospira bourretii]|uniref:polymorphic toxin-type HINT domain-containing protein n=1 Tax=Leptospira bourretii TaxID=2484962 RepID=UPI001ABF4148|nr:polymorphic toxin-type HINT domain-containing protein [Leptospira bourretii]
MSELQADTAVAANKAEAEEWAERAMRFSIAETKIKDKMQELQRQINDARNALDATMDGLIGPGLNPAVNDGRLDFNSYDYKYQETRLREFYKIADGMATGKIGGWDFIHGGRGSVDPPTFSGGLAYIHPSISISGYLRQYGGNGSLSVAAERGFDGVWIFNGGAPSESAYNRMTSYNYWEFEAKMNNSLGNVMAGAVAIIAFMSWGNPLTAIEAITRNKTWVDSKIAIDNAVNTARSQANTLKSLQEELNRYTDISTGEQLIDMLKGGPAKGYVETGLEDSDVAFLTGASGQLKNGTINWTGGKEPLSIDRLVGKNGDPIIQKRAIKDSYGLFIREGVVTAGSPSTSSNVGYANDGRMVNIMTSADEFVGSLASISKTQYTIEKEEYYAVQEAAIVRGVKADKREILDDRDRFYSNLLNKVTGGTGKNIEYDMYKTLVEDYYGQGNVTDQLYALNESQQREYQLKVWDNKEKDFQAKKADWIENVNYLMETGSARFNDMLTSFNQSWDQWRRDFKEETDKGKAEHMARIEEALKKKTDWEVNLLNQARKGDQFEIDQVYAEIQKTIANMGSVPNTVLLQNNANKILNTIMNSKPQVLDNRMLEQGMYADVQFFVDELKKSKYDESNVEKMKSMTKEMEDRSKQMAVLQTLDSLWSLPLTFEATIKEQNKALDEQLTMQLLQDNFIKLGSAYVRSAVDKLGNPTYQMLPSYADFVYIKPDKLPTVKDSNGKEWDLTDYQSLQGKDAPASAELTMMVRLARNQMQTDFKQTFDPEKSENREVGLTMLDPKAMARVAQAAQSALGQLATDPQKMFEFNSADEKGKEAMIESAKNSGYLVGPTVGGTFGTHHFNQYYPILKMKEMYNEIKAEGESVQGDPFVKSAKSLGGPMAATYVAKNLDTLKAVDAVLSSIPIVDRLNPLAMLKSFGNGGILGVVTNVASVVTETASLILSGLTTKVSVDYSYDNGFGASVDFGFGVGAARVSVANASYSEHGGFAASIGVTGKIGSVELGARVTYSEKEGFGASVGAKVGNFVAGVSYTQNGGFGAQVGYKNSNGAISGLSYSEKTGLSASVGVTNGDYSGGLSYNAQEGFGAFVARNDYDKATDKTSGSQALTFNQRDGVGVKVSSNTANGDHSLGISQRGGINYEGSYNGHTVSANYSKDGGFGVSYTNGGSTIEYSSQSGFSGSYNNNNNPAYGDIVGNSVVTSQGALMGAMDSIAENVHGEYMEVDRAKKKWLESKGPIKFPEGKSSWDDLTDEEKETLVQNKSAEINGKPKRDQHTTRDSVWERMKGNVSDFADQLGGTYGDHSGWIDPKTGQFVDRTCFVAGTKVHTKEGLKNIEDIQVGDLVLSKSDETGEVSYRKVVNTFIRQTDAIYTVSFADGTVLETTWNHPFRVKKQGHALEKFSIETTDWVEAKDLHPGDVALGADGKELVVSNITIDERKETVYNFEVEEYHTYFVGEVGVWVHNNDDSYIKGNGLLFTNTLQSNLRPDGAKKINEGIDDAVEGAKDLAVETAKECVDGGVGSAICAASITPWGRVGAALKGIPIIGNTIKAISNSASRIGQRVKGIFGGSKAVEVTASKGTTRFIDGVRVVDKRTGKVLEGTVDLKPTLQRIEQGGRFPHRNDGSIFNNRPLPGKTTPELPVKPDGYYTEYVHPTPGVQGPGPQRIVRGANGDMWYTPDHYDSFIRLNP